MRSKLFVPGVRPELFAKALAGRSRCAELRPGGFVPEAASRQPASQVSRSCGPRVARRAKLIVLRVNALDTPHLQADLAAIARPGDLVNLPRSSPRRMYSLPWTCWRG